MSDKSMGYIESNVQYENSCSWAVPLFERKTINLIINLNVM